MAAFNMKIGKLASNREEIAFRTVLEGGTGKIVSYQLSWWPRCCLPWAWPTVKGKFPLTSIDCASGPLLTSYWFF